MKYFIVFLTLLLVLSLCSCAPGEPETTQPPVTETEEAVSEENPEEVWENPQMNPYTLKKLRMVGKGESSENYKIAFFEPETLEGAEAFLICFSVSDFDTVWNYLSGLSRDEIFALDKPVNKAYIMTDLSYCDGVGNTFNTAQKDLISGEDFSAPGTHYFYAAVIGPQGLLSLERTQDTLTIDPIADELTFTVAADGTLSGSFRSYPEGDIQQNYVFAAREGFESVRESLASSNRASMDALGEKGWVLALDNAEENPFTLNLDELRDFRGELLDPAGIYYLYVASADSQKLLGLSYCSERFITPRELPQSSGIIGDGAGMIFPNGGAAQLGGGRGSILSTSQAIFKDLPQNPRVAVIGAASGSEREFWAHFHLDDSKSKSFAARLGEAGFEAVYLPLTAENRDSIGEDPYFAALLSSCHGVYFTGGDQSLGMYALTRQDGSLNLLGEALTDLYARGGFLAGTSAGAHMLGNLCFQDSDRIGCLNAENPAQKAVLSSEGVHCGPEGVYYDGLPCVVDAAGHSVIFDSHFGARGRLARLAVMQGTTGAEFAVGLDEATGLAISQGVGVVYGDGTVTVIDRSGAEYGTEPGNFTVKSLRVWILAPGDRFDFTARTLIPGASRVPAQGVPAPEAPQDLLGDSSAQTLAFLHLALSQEDSILYGLGNDQTAASFILSREEGFGVYAGEKNFELAPLSSLPQLSAGPFRMDIGE